MFTANPILHGSAEQFRSAVLQAYSMHEHGDLSEEPRREKVSLVPEDGRSHLLPEHGTGRRKRKETES